MSKAELAVHESSLRACESKLKACTAVFLRTVKKENEMLPDKETAKKLVEQLKKKGLANSGSLGLHSGLFDEAANMIEALLAERDAAMDDLCGEAFSESRECRYCEYLHSPSKMEPCKSCHDGHYCRNWKYKGPALEEQNEQDLFL